MVKKLSLVIAVFFLLFLARDVFASESAVTLHLFWSKACPHCAKEKTFVSALKSKYPKLQIKEYEITENRENLKLLEETAKALSTTVSGVPFTVIGTTYITGYVSDEVTGKEIEDAVSCAFRDGCTDIVSSIAVSGSQSASAARREVKLPTLSLPIFGSLDLTRLSLPALTIVIGLMDGFNPCAMWTLLFLISLLLGMKSRRRMWALGSAFIAASGLVYFLFLSAWLNFFLFAGAVLFIRIAIAIVALGSGAWYLKEYFTNKGNTCTVVEGHNKRQKVFERIREVVNKRAFVLAFVGIILLAFAVNAIELFCSLGLPAVYTKVLATSRLPVWQYYGYLVLYIIFFMLDDMVVFVTAMVTLRAVGPQSKYGRISHLVGGVLMLAIGILLLFKPQLLMFG